MNKRLKTSIALIASICISPTFAEPHTQQANSLELDALSYLTLNAFMEGRHEQATQHVAKLTQLFPDYPLGHLLKAEIYQAQGMQTGKLAQLSAYSPNLVKLLLEAKTRAQSNPIGNSMQTQALVPELLIQSGKHIDHIVIADVEQSILYLFDTRTNTPLLVKKHYVSSGKGGFDKSSEGDLKTPLGVYSITGFRSEASLPALYGSGALMLDYPNALDTALGRNGSGIWLHGIPAHSRSRSPRSSEGCVTMANDHLIALHAQLNPQRSMVVLSSKLNWLDSHTANNGFERFQELFNQYRDAWANQSYVDLKSIYSAAASHKLIKHSGTGSMSRVSNTSQPAKLHNGVNIAALKTVQAADIAIIKNPSLSNHNAQNYIVMSIKLGELQSGKITLYWQQNTHGHWQIIQEVINVNGA